MSIDLFIIGLGALCLFLLVGVAVVKQLERIASALEEKR